MAKAQKIVLGKRPEKFAKEVTFPMLDGADGSILVEFQYRTRTEFAKLSDKVQEEIRARTETDVAKYRADADAAAAAGKAAPEMRASDIAEREAEFRVKYIMDAVVGWNLDIPFDREAVEQLVDELPAAATAIISTYREAITEGRLGN